jgi:hypothetical protein
MESEIPSGEPGILPFVGQCRLCFALALWNGKDPILKERLFGLTGSEGNHGEDVKECYFYLDSAPTHSYMRALYKYPQAEFPYWRLIEENRRRGLQAPEFELTDAGVFDDDRYFDVFAEYAKNSPNDILIRITISNRGPTLWFRNTWSWGPIFDELTAKPSLALVREGLVRAEHGELGEYQFAYDKAGEPLFTENETNAMRLFGVQNSSPYVKDAFHEYIIQGRKDAINPNWTGTKFSPCFALGVDAGGSETIRLRLSAKAESPAEPFLGFDEIFTQRMREADGFYASKIPAGMPEEVRAVARQGYAGLLWSKQFYHYVIRAWLTGDSTQPPPPPNRKQGRNREWMHLFNRDIISMPIGNAEQPVLAPSVGSATGVIVREVVPATTISRVVFAHGRPLPFGEIRSPAFPVLSSITILGKTDVFSF